MSAIAWSTLAGETVEKLISVYICRKFTGAVAVRPSQGDKGIDVRIDHQDGSITVFQIKKFAQTLSTSQKRQIKASWDALTQYVDEEKKVLRAWHLVMPLNPTNENKAWFDELTAEAECEVIWDGLAQVESWAAEMPEVADYYLHDGKNRALKYIEKMASILHTPSPEDTDAITRSLRDICDLLDQIDPNYSYSIHVFSKHDKTDLDLRNLCQKTNAVMSQEEFLPDGTRIRIDLLPKYSMATTVEPIEFNVTILAETATEKDQVKRFFEVGSPLEKVPAQIKGLNKAIPLMEVNPNQTGVLYSFPIVPEKSSLEIHLSTGASGIALQETLFTRGKSGARWEGCDSSGIFNTVIEAHVDGKWTLSIRFLPEEEPRPSNHEAQKLFEFLNSWATLNEASLMMDGRHTAIIPFDAYSIDRTFINCGYELTNALEIIDSASFEDVLFPKMSALSNRDVGNVKLNAELIENGTQELVFNELGFEYAQEICPIEAPCVPVVVQELRTKVDTEIYRCGYVEGVIPVGKVVKKETGKTALLSTEDYGNTYIRRLVVVAPADLDQVNQIFARKIGDPDEWLCFKNDYLERTPIEADVVKP